MPGLELNLNANLRQQQELRLAPTQLQRLEVLQATNLELQQRVSQALLQNPLLEQVNQPLTVSLEEAGMGQQPSAEDFQARRDRLEGEDYQAEVYTRAVETATGRGAADDARAGDGADAQEPFHDEPDWAEMAAEERFRGYRNPEAEERRQYFFDSVAGEEDFYTKLLRQAEEVEGTEEFKHLCQTIALEIDRDGYLRMSDGELAALCNAPEAEVHRAVAALQRLGPPGIAAHDLRECLLLQLEAQGLVHSLEWDVVDKHLEEVAKNRIPEIARAIDADEDETEEAIYRIKHELTPVPGHGLAVELKPHVYPDVVVEYDEEGRLQVRMAEDAVPILVFNSEYMDLRESANAEERKYFTEKFNQAYQLIQAIDQRQRTIEKVAAVLVDFQKEYFETGRKDTLKPLTLAKVAERLDLAESTVSRAIDGKYFRAPWGVCAFKDLFSFGYRTASGELVSSQQIMHRIRQLIEAEDPAHPLSDQAISDLLQKEGFDCKRRTVTNYRALENIPTSNDRKKRT